MSFMLNATIRPGNPQRKVLGDVGNKPSAQIGKQGPIKRETVKIVQGVVKKTAVTATKRVGPTASQPPPKKTLLPSRKSFGFAVSPPSGVKDIDIHDTDPQLCPDLAVPIYAYLRSLERETQIPLHYLKGSSISPKMRSVLIDWLMEVHHRFSLFQETLYLTVSLLDRFLSSPTSNIKRRQLQLAGVTAMLIASKTEDIFCPEIADFVYITDKSCSSQEIRDMEKTILKTLNFRVNSPLPIFFLRRCSKAGEVTRLQHNLAKYFLEVGLISYELIHEPSSLQGAAALWLATLITIESEEATNSWSDTQAFYSGYTMEEMRPCVRKFANVVYNSGTSKYRAPHNKYAHSNLLKVSLLPELRSEKMRLILEGYF